ncbi:MAG: 30S ribosomal protein S6 [Cytophagaceae bacterium]|nr:30S ribosomal protein S6 [Cytophagaceae bacterium]
MANQYETVFILTPVLSDTQTKDTVEKFRKLLTDQGVEFVHEDPIGLRKLAYPIQGKNTGHYQLFEYRAEPGVPAAIEVEFRRDERVMRFLTIALDKHAIDYNERKRKGLVGKKTIVESPVDAK